MLEAKLCLRRISKAKATFIFAVASLAVGIATVTAVHALLDRAFFRPLEWAVHGDLVGASQGEQPTDIAEYRYGDAALLAQRQDLFLGVTTFGSIFPDPLLTTDTATTSASTLMVGESYFEVLGIGVQLGRTFQLSDYRTTTQGTAIVSDRLWRDHFQRSPSVIGSTIRVNSIPLTIVGVVPGWFRGTDISTAPDVYLPLQLTSLINPLPHEWLDKGSPLWLKIVARLRPSVSRDMANAAISTVAARDTTHAFLARTRLVDLQRLAIPRVLWNEFHTIVSLFGYAAAVVLLVASLTVGTLLLLQAESRSADIAVSLAVGASRRRLILWSWIQALLPAGVGAALAAPLVLLILHFFARFAPRSGVIFRELRFPFSWRVFVGGVFCALLVSVIVTALSTRGIPSTEVGASLRDGGSGSIVRRRRSRAILVVVQVACSTALLISVLLLARSVRAIYSVDLGYSLTNLLELDVDMLRARATDAERLQLYDSILTALQAGLPSSQVGRTEQDWLFRPDAALGLGKSSASGHGGGATILVRTVSPGYLAALGLRVIEGRLFTSADLVHATGLAVVSQKAGKLLAPLGTALGHRLGRALGYGMPTVIGVVADARLDPLAIERPTIYLLSGVAPPDQSGIARSSRQTTIVVRTTEARSAARIVRNSLGPWVGSSLRVRRTEERVRSAAAVQRFVMACVGVLTIVATTLAMISILVLISSTIRLRMREIAIRMCLGATSTALVKLIVADTIVIAALGIVLGTGVMVKGAQLLQHLLFGIVALDTVSFVSAIVLLICSSALAGLAPALRVFKIVPSAVLRAS